MISSEVLTKHNRRGRLMQPVEFARWVNSLVQYVQNLKNDMFLGRNSDGLSRVYVCTNCDECSCGDIKIFLDSAVDKIDTLAGNASKFKVVITNQVMKAEREKFERNSYIL